MAKLKSFEQFLSEMDRAEEVQQDEWSKCMEKNYEREES